MFGRVHRAALTVCPDVPIEAYGLLHAYSPATATGAIAAGMGAGAIGAGSASVTLPDGRSVSAVGEALNSIQRAGRKLQQRYITLPGHVLVVVTDHDVRLWRWNTASTLGEQVACWTKGTFTASSDNYSGQTGVRIKLSSGLMALLTGSSSDETAEQLIDAIIWMGRT